MRVVCPSCRATYEVPAPLLGSEPRRVRCAKCQTVWTADAPAPEFAAGESLDRAGDEMTGSSPAGIASRPKDGADPDAPGGASSDADMSLADMLRRQDVDGAIAGTLPALGDLRPTRARAGTVSLSGARQPLAATATPPRNEALRAVMAWVASLAVLGSCVAAIIVWRGDVARIWPPSERLYSAIGLR